MEYDSVYLDTYDNHTLCFATLHMLCVCAVVLWLHQKSCWKTKQNSAIAILKPISSTPLLVLVV